MLATGFLALICVFTATALPYGIVFDADKMKRLQERANPADVAQFNAHLRAQRRSCLACCCRGRGSDVSPVLNALELLGSLRPSAPSFDLPGFLFSALWLTQFLLWSPLRLQHQRSPSQASLPLHIFCLSPHRLLASFMTFFAGVMLNQNADAKAYVAAATACARGETAQCDAVDAMPWNSIYIPMTLLWLSMALFALFAAWWAWEFVRSLRAQYKGQIEDGLGGGKQKLADMLVQVTHWRRKVKAIIHKKKMKKKLKGSKKSVVASLERKASGSTRAPGALAGGCKQMQSIDLSDCDKITDRGLKALAEGCK